MTYFYRKTVIVWMLACIFGCIAINAQPSLKEQKVKVEKWDRKLKVMQSQSFVFGEKNYPSVK